MQPFAPHRCRMLALLIGLAGAVSVSIRDVEAQGGGSAAPANMPTPAPIYRRGLEWILFPCDPPALGSVLASSMQVSLSDPQEPLRVFFTEPFYTPLATRAVWLPGEPKVERAFNLEEKVRLEAFVRIRTDVLDEIYREVRRVQALPQAERRVAFESLARSQAARLDEMDRMAEWLRDRLGRSAPWGAHRQWRLGVGPLRLPREQTVALECQVVRAAAYYQTGLSSAQRRLARELAMEMEETIATRGVRAEESPVLYFSPDTARIARPKAPPGALADRIARYMADKRRLKDELRDGIYATETMALAFRSRRHLEELAYTQESALEDLERLADEIRVDLARLGDYPRHRGGVRLSETLERRLEAYSREGVAIEAERTAYIRLQVGDLSLPESERTEGESHAGAAAAFNLNEHERLVAHDREGESLLADLTEVLPEDERVWLSGTADAALRRFLERRADQDSYRDYDLAAIEPGFSPAQRRVLFAAAMARLRLAVRQPEQQPFVAPQTLYGGGTSGP